MAEAFDVKFSQQDDVLGTMSTTMLSAGSQGAHSQPTHPQTPQHPKVASVLDMELESRAPRTEGSSKRMVVRDERPTLGSPRRRVGRSLSYTRRPPRPPFVHRQYLASTCTALLHHHGRVFQVWCRRCCSLQHKPQASRTVLASTSRITLKRDVPVLISKRPITSMKPNSLHGARQKPRQRVTLSSFLKKTLQRAVQALNSKRLAPNTKPKLAQKRREEEDATESPDLEEERTSG